MFVRCVGFASLLGLAACGTPQQQCISANTHELRTLERLIAQTEGNLARGYALDDFTTTRVFWVPCAAPTPAPGTPAQPAQSCLEEIERTETRPVAINLDAERAKLASMQKKRAQLARAAQPVIAACKAQYPQ